MSLARLRKIQDFITMNAIYIVLILLISLLPLLTRDFYPLSVYAIF